MGPKSLAYQLCILFTGLNLLCVGVAGIASAQLLAITSHLPAAERARLGAVTLLELFLFAAVAATSAAVTLYVKRDRKNPAAA